jgi:hypothetical protein
MPAVDEEPHDKRQRQRSDQHEAAVSLAAAFLNVIRSKNGH